MFYSRYGGVWYGEYWYLQGWVWCWYSTSSCNWIVSSHCGIVIPVGCDLHLLICMYQYQGAPVYIHHTNYMFCNVAKALGLVACSPPESVQSNNVRYIVIVLSQLQVSIVAGCRTQCRTMFTWTFTRSVVTTWVHAKSSPLYWVQSPGFINHVHYMFTIQSCTPCNMPLS